MGIVMIVQFVLLVGSSMYYAVKGNKDAVIFNAGFAIFAVVGLSESAAFFLTPRLQSLPLEMGIVSFIIALIVILGRHFAKTTNGFNLRSCGLKRAQFFLTEAAYNLFLWKWGLSASLLP